MTPTKTKIFMLIRDGATLAQLMDATSRDGTFIRRVISDIRSRGFNVTFSNDTYAIGA